VPCRSAVTEGPPGEDSPPGGSHISKEIFFGRLGRPFASAMNHPARSVPSLEKPHHRHRSDGRMYDDPSREGGTPIHVNVRHTGDVGAPLAEGLCANAVTGARRHFASPFRPTSQTTWV
jgi:hypothetical protein